MISGIVIPPFAPTVAMLRDMLAYGQDMPAISPRSLARTTIAGDRILSVPVEGGASALKRHGARICDLSISDHGRWRQEHLGAWQAAYRKTPYFSFLFPEIENAYLTASHGSLLYFNRELLHIALRFLDIEGTRESILEMKRLHPSRLEEVIYETEAKVNINYSIFDSLFRLGKNTVYLFPNEKPS